MVIGTKIMNNPSRQLDHRSLRAFASVFLVLLAFARPTHSQSAAPSGTNEPPPRALSRKPVSRATRKITRASVDEMGMRTLVSKLVACGTRSTFSSWTDKNRGIGCGRDVLAQRFGEIATNSGGRLQLVVDKFETTSEQTSSKTVQLENVYAILPGRDPQLAKTVFIVSGHYDSRPSDGPDADADAPGADDDASGTTVSVECARLLSRPGTNFAGPYRATILFAALSGEEQGLFGSTRLLEWVKLHGYAVGGMLNDDIVGADQARRLPHPVRLFSGSGEIDDGDSPSRELARAIEEITGSAAVRMIFRPDRDGRYGDQYPFYRAGLPAVRFTEPREDYRHQHQTPRIENGIEYGDLEKYLSFSFLAEVVRDNAEALRQLALAPAPPRDVKLNGAGSPDSRVSWSADDDPERAGFEILWRETTSPRWRVHDCLASPGEFVVKGLPVDNYFFAVRSVGKNRARSIAVPAER
jgi:hypothetical protein